MGLDVKILMCLELQSITRTEDVTVKPWYHQSEWQNASGHASYT